MVVEDEEVEDTTMSEGTSPKSVRVRLKNVPGVLGDLLVDVENTLTGRLERHHLDMLVLAVGLVPRQANGNGQRSLDEILSLIAEDAEALNCVDEVGNARNILTRGTSAHRQLKTYEIAEAGGADNMEALKSVVDQLIQDTAAGL